MELSIDQLQHLFGKRGTLLYQLVRGQDDRPVEPNRERKSVGKETTFALDLRDREEMLVVLERLAEQVELRMAELGLAGRTLTLKLRWNDFRIVSRNASTPHPIQDGQTMMQYVRPLLDRLLQEHRPVRLLGISLSHLVSDAEIRKHEQIQRPSLWEEA
jgi:DNA polymerase-4